MVCTLSRTEIEEQFCPLSRSRAGRQGLGVLMHELSQFHYASLVVPADAMKLTLLFPGSGLVPDTVKEILVQLMRPQAITLQAVE